jgi:hypothetical protein
VRKIQIGDVDFGVSLSVASQASVYLLHFTLKWIWNRWRHIMELSGKGQPIPRFGRRISVGR